MTTASARRVKMCKCFGTDMKSTSYQGWTWESMIGCEHSNFC